jgi:Transposase DDE domain
MIFSSVFERFIAASPMAVMVRMVLERLLPAAAIDRLFQDRAQTQYTKELLFSTCVKGLCLVVCRMFKSIGATYAKHRDEYGVAIKNVYAKLQGVEPVVLQALVQHSASEAQTHIRALLPNATPHLPGYRLRILDGNKLAATQKRLLGLRGHSAAPLPGQSLVIFDPDVNVIVEALFHQDAHTQERALLDQVEPLIQAGDLWIGDRNFCVIDFLQRIKTKQACFLMRHHAQVTLKTQGEFSQAVETTTGWVSEASVWLCRDDQELFTARLIRVRLKSPTTAGETEIRLLTNLPATVLAEIVAKLYLLRWTIEAAFQALTVNLRCEIDTLAYPPAALFGFAIALMMYNVLSVAQAALASAHGSEKIEKEFSGYYLVEELAGEYRGMVIALPAEEWQFLDGLSFQEFIGILKTIAQGVRLERYRKAPRKPKKPSLRIADDTPHVATAKILDKKKLQ